MPAVLFAGQPVLFEYEEERAEKEGKHESLFENEEEEAGFNAALALALTSSAPVNSETATSSEAASGSTFSGAEFSEEALAGEADASAEMPDPQAPPPPPDNTEPDTSKKKAPAQVTPPAVNPPATTAPAGNKPASNPVPAPPATTGANGTTGIPGDTTKKGNGKYVPSRRPQFDAVDRHGDPFSNPGYSSPLVPGNPGNVKTDVTLDSMQGDYDIREKAGEVDVRPPSTMTFEEYTRWRQREDMKNYMRAKSEENSGGQGPMSNNRLIPKIYFNPAFDRIFGGNSIDLKPNGTVVLDFGINSQQVANPALPLRQQRNTQFLFDQQISVNVQGKVGEKVKLSINYDTKANFEFDNNVKVDYTGLDNEIIKKIELGNVSLPISSRLITGANNLFGAKATMQFGRLKVVAVASSQRSRMDQLKVKGSGNGGGAQNRDINIRCDDYDANRHFFLSQFFRNNYEKALNNPAIVPPASGVFINRVDVYISNKQNNTANMRNVIGFADLGEGVPYNKKWGGAGSREPAGNDANKLFRTVVKDKLLQGDVADERLKTAPEYLLKGGTDYEMLPGARKLTDRDFTFHPQLGYISLVSPLVNQDDIVGVAYEYTYNGRVYTVGQPTGAAANVADTGKVIVKMLRSTTNNVSLPMWDLQMKNVYSLGSSGIQRDGFLMRIIYRDDSTGVDNPALRQGRRVANRQLTQLLNADRLNPANELIADGQYDFIDKVTIDATKGLLIFPVLEPFGKFLQSKFDADEAVYVDHYVFNELYRTTKALAKQYANKNKYYIMGSVQSTAGSSVSLNALNLSPGSVKVYAGLTLLTEGTDYTVDYTQGKVTVNPTILAGGQEITFKYEKADLFSFQQRSFFGTRMDYAVNPDINIGGSLLYLNERPLIRRVSVGEEPASNVLYGIDVNVKKESRLITKIVDALPFLQTKEPSMVTFQGEYAQLIPGTSTFVDASGKGISYIDDFEGAPTLTDLTYATTMWKFASVPLGYGMPGSSKLSTNFRRARLAWFNMDNLFFSTNGSLRPKNITNDDMKANYVRAVLPQEVFPNRQPGAIVTPQPVLDLNFYPSERGPYNFTTAYNADGTLRTPENNWAGITHSFGTNGDFDAANTEYIEFWMMDPFHDEDVGGNSTGTLRTGKMYINLGSVSEDVLEDSKHEAENTIPADGSTTGLENTVWGRTANQPPISNSFDNEGNRRTLQDIGLDGIDNHQEEEYHADYIAAIQGSGITQDIKDKLLADPAGDDFRHYLDSRYDGATNAKVLERYKHFNDMEGNSPVNTGGSYTASSTNEPDNEDINRDNTVTPNNNYYKYRVDIDPNSFQVGRNYIVDYQKATGKDVGWYLFRVPFRDLSHPNYAGKEGDITDFRSIRFMRMFLTGFKVPVSVRMVQLRTVGSTWRPYDKPLPPSGPYTNDEHDAAVTVGTVNIEENGSRGDGKVAYVVPPGLPRDRDITSGINRQLNEQSLSMCVERLRPNSAQAVFKTLKVDFLNYQRLRLWVSASTHDPNTKDEDVNAFIRIGTDYTDNYYEVEVPLKLTALGTTAQDQIWKAENEINVLLAELYSLKVERNVNRISQNAIYSRTGAGESKRMIVSVKGNPDLNTATIAMLGVRCAPGAGSRPKNLCVWFDEMRVTDFLMNAGWATTGTLAIKLADLGTFNATGQYTSVGFGGIEQRISERARNWVYSYNLSTNLALDKFLPKSIGLKLPMYASFEQNFTDPKYDPLNPDIELEKTLGSIQDAKVREFYKKIVQDKTTRKNISFTNVQKTKTGTGISFPWDISNISLTYSYSELHRTNVNLQDYRMRTWKYAAAYTYSTSGGNVEPFKKMFKSPWFKLITDFNVGFLPSTLNARVDLDRSFTRTQLRSSDVFATTNTILPTFEKSFMMTRVYGARYSPAKSLTLDYTATVSAIIDEPRGDVSSKDQQDTIVNNLKKLGRTKSFNQTMSASYKLPIDKTPLTDWLGADARYNVGYIWTASPQALQDTLGNTIQNSRERSINAKADLVRFYNKIPWLAKINNPPPKPAATKPGAKDGKDGKGKTGPKAMGPGAKADTVKKPREYKLIKGFARLLMSIRSANASYSETENTILPGFRPSPSFFGNSNDFAAPGWKFITGDQSPSIKDTAEKYKWLGSSTLQNQNFAQTKTINLTGRVSIEPVRDFRIQLDAKKTTTSGYQETFRNVDSLNEGLYEFHRLNPTQTGSYTVSYIFAPTAFGTADKSYNDEAYRAFEKNLDIIAGRLMNPGENPNILKDPTVPFTRVSQDVLLPSLLAAYTGEDAHKTKLNSFPRVPLPNWRIDYAGLTRIPFLADKFSSISLTHAYTGAYTVSSYTSSLAYGQSLGLANSPSSNTLPSLTDTSGGTTVWVPTYIINSVTISEKFAPLVGINMRTKNKITLKLDYNKERSINMNTTNAQMAELNSWDITFGVGYQKSGMNLPFKVKGRTVTLKNEVTMRCDIMIRDTRTVQHKLLEPGVVTQGQQNVQIKPTANYVVNKSLNIQAYLEYTVDTPKVSTSYKRSQTKFGVQMRFTLQ